MFAFNFHSGSSGKINTSGISLAVAVLAAVMGAFVWIALPLLVLAVLLFAGALEPKRIEAFVGRLPYSNYLLKALAKLDLVPPAGS
jgi:hypothetical protein